MTQGHRLSLPVAWLFCYGMCYSDPVQQAQHNVARLLALKEDSLHSDEDVQAVTRFFCEYAEHLAPEVYADAVKRLEATHPLLRGFVSLQVAA